MSASADDLRYFYAETLGPTTEVALSNTAARNAAALEPGRYVVRVRGLVTGVQLWLKQGGSAVTATTSAPSTPFELGGTVTDAASVRAANEPLLTLMVRTAADGFISGILNAGTATLVLTKVSRGRS